jgi:uracil-DNA glycosylase family 4
MSTIQDYVKNLLLQSTPNAVVPPQKPTRPFNGLAFVGIAPSTEEVEQGQVFCGPSGQILNKSLHLAGIDRTECWTGNLIPVKLPQNRPPSRGEVSLFRGSLIQTLKEMNPKVIVTMGAEPTRAFFPETDIQIMTMRSHVLECPDLPGVQIIPTIHPSFALRQSLSLVALLLNDLIIAKDVLAGNPRYRPWTYEYITNLEQLESILTEHKGELLFIDTEATSTNPHQAELFIVSFAFSGNPDKGFVIHTPSLNYDGVMGPEELLDGTNHLTPRERVLDILKKHNFQTGIFNMLYDYILLQRFGYAPDVHIDPMYAFTLIDENCPKSLSNLGSFFSGIGPYTMDYASTDLQEWLPYAACDAVNSVRVWNAIKKNFEEPTKKNLLFKYLMPLLKTLAKVSITGLGVDLTKLAEVDKQLSTDISTKVQLMQQAVGFSFNHRSGDQLANVFKKLGIPVRGMTKTGKPSFAKEILKGMAERYPFVQTLLDVKSMEKMHSSYVKNIQNYVDEHNRVHTSFDIKKTGRLSAKEPALQTLPRKSIILELFAAKPGHTLIKCDFSAAELRWMGFLAGQTEWLDPTIDIHVNNASFFFKVPREQVTDEMRTKVKFVAFGKIYGSSDALLAKQLKTTEQEAKKLNDIFFKTFPKVYDFMTRTEEKVNEVGTVQNWYGLERHFFFDMQFGTHQDRARAVREGYNFGPQSTVAMWTNMSLIKVQNWLEQNMPEAQVVLQIHDAIVVETPNELLPKAVAAIWHLLRRPICKKTGFFLPVDTTVGTDLKHQELIIPFYVQNLEEMGDIPLQKAS